MGHRLEVYKLWAAFLSPALTLAGFAFVWQQLKNTAEQIGLAKLGFDASNAENVKAQDWKRAEFLAAEMKDFFDNPAVATATRMFDYNSRSYSLGVRDKAGEPVVTRVVHSATDDPRGPEEASYASLEKTLARSKSEEDALIRDILDIFFSRIERFEQFVHAKLVSEEEVYPYLRYHLKMFRGRIVHVRPAITDAARRYLKRYHFVGAEHLLFDREYGRFKAELNASPTEAPPDADAAAVKTAAAAPAVKTAGRSDTAAPDAAAIKTAAASEAASDTTKDATAP